MTARYAHGPIMYLVHFLFAVLTGLVPYGTGGLACGLAGCLALTAAALFHCVLQFPGI